MSGYVIIRITNIISKLQNAFSQAFRNPFPPEYLAFVATHDQFSSGLQNRPTLSLRDLIGDGILWAVPKHRRSVEKRLKRKFGQPDYVWKPLKLKTHLSACKNCGNNHEIGVLCPHCYAKVRNETQLMQDKIQEKLGLDAVEQEIVVLYEGEQNEQPSVLLDGKRIVEMEKTRPIWFSKNLIQKSTQKPDTTKEAKPSDLG